MQGNDLSLSDNETVINFGRNVRFTPRFRYAPRTEAEVLDLLDRHAQGKVRVVGALHSWNPAVVSDDVLVDLENFDAVSVGEDADGNGWVIVGAGCRIKDLLHQIHARSRFTLPTLGMISEQTVGGAIATGTHGSGKPSLSHFVDAIVVAAYDPENGRARIYQYTEGPELRAARCSLGCMGIILSVRFRAVPRYDVAETIVYCNTLDEVLAGQEEYPLQQFLLIPHRWSYIVQRRRAILPASERRSWLARLYRVYWFYFLNVSFHLQVKQLVSGLRSRARIRWFYRRMVPLLAIRNVTVIDSSERQLLMQHELFRHLGIEIFVPSSQLQPATEFLCAVLAAFDNSRAVIPEAVATPLKKMRCYETLLALRGSFTLHYPVGFRRVLPDDTLISMTAGADEAYYGLSILTYGHPREPFTALASFLASTMAALFGSRLHWGKYFPLTHAEVEPLYPNLDEFRRLCCRTDPRGVFRNDFIARALGFSDEGKTAGM